MGHDKLRKFAENETFSCLLQPAAGDLLADGFFSLKDHPVKGNWNGKMFTVPREIVLELGCGKGEYTIDLSKRIPSRNYVGVDIKGARLWKGAGQAESEKLGNVAFLRTRIEFITALFAPGEVSEIWLTFSDPQMKSENSRLTSPLFLERYRNILKKGGIIHLKTDSMFLHQYSKAVAEANGLKILACTEDLYSTSRSQFDALPEQEADALFEVQTFYEKMFLEQGYRITYLSFVIDKEGEYVHPDFDEEYWRKAEGPKRSFSHQPSKKQ